jgi:hypothetical protein
MIAGSVVVGLAVCCASILVYRHFMRSRYAVAAANAHESSIEFTMLVDADYFDERIPSSVFNSTMIDFGDSTCSICLEVIEGGASVKKLNCKHLFHAS